MRRDAACLKTRALALARGVRSLTTVTACVLALASGFDAQAQSYPSRPVRIVVPFAAGGAVDIVARATGQELASRLGQPFIIENRTGAGGNIAADHVAKSSPDGYTLLMASPGNAVNATLFRQLPFNPATDFTPVALVGAVPTVMLAGPAMPAKDFNEFLVSARAKPNSINYGSGGTGTTEHLAAVMLSSSARISMVHIPYKGGASAMTDLRGGQIPVMFTNLAGALAPIRSGHVRALAIASDKRSPAIPDTPTFAELGFPDLRISVWWGVMGPAGLPRAVVERLNSAVNEVLSSEDFKQRLSAMSAEPLPGSADAFAVFFAKEIQMWGETVRQSGAQAE